MTRILLIQGNPDPAPERYGRCLAQHYAEAALAAGHELRRIDLAELEFPRLRGQQDWQHGTPPAAIRKAQEDLLWCQHLVLIFPLWMGSAPALVKGFFEQLLRPGFAVGGGDGKGPPRPLRGRSARLVVTMGMPAWLYRWYFRAHGLSSLRRNLLGLCGIGPIRSSLIGQVEAKDDRARRRWLHRMRQLGQAGD